jgi:hypothetical protein
MLQGHRIDFLRPPSSFVVASKSLPPALSAAAVDEIRVYLRDRTIVPVQRPRFSCAMFVVVQPSKLRPVVDCRPLNVHVRHQYFRIEGWRIARQLLMPGDYMCVIDITRAFHHIPLHPSSTDRLQFNFAGRHYAWRALPFGYSAAPRVITKALGEVVRFLRREAGLRLTFHIDDFIVMGSSPEETEWARECLVTTLRALGFTINPSKGQWAPAQVATYLGFQLDTRSAHTVTVRLPVDKLAAIRSFASTLLASAARSQRRLVPKRKLARLVGSLIAAHPAVWEARMRTRELYNRMNSTRAWNGCVRLNQQALADLHWMSSMPEQACSRALRPARLLRSLRVFADASGSIGWGAVMGPTTARDGWSPPQRAWSITHKEVFAALAALQSFLPRLADNQVVLYTDNQAAMQIINNGTTRSPPIMQTVRDIYRLTTDHHIDLRLRYIPTTLNPADTPSRTIDPHDWRIASNVFTALQHRFGQCSFDLFASSSNHVLPQFASFGPCPGTAAIDAFSLDWSTLGRAWANPPFALLHRVLLHAQLTKARITLVAPEWRGQPWWPLLVSLADAIVTLPPPSEALSPGCRTSSEPRRNSSWRLLAASINCSSPPPYRWSTTSRFPPL